VENPCEGEPQPAPRAARRRIAVPGRIRKRLSRRPRNHRAGDPRLKRAIRLLAFGLAALAAAWLIGRIGGGAILDVGRRVDALGSSAPLVYVGVYIVAVVAMAPGSILTLAAGALFGLWPGLLVAIVGATGGATAAFLVSRYVARPLVERRISRAPRFSRLDHMIEQNGFRVVFLLRLSPVLPFNLLNYALGATRVRLGQFVLGTIGMFPGTFLYVYYGRLAGDLAALAAGEAAPRGTAHYALLALGLAATLALTVLATRLARRALREETADDDISSQG
jgi:uncharacterized membrane protein YdjX (TVP38/TMEM64 family)